MKKEKDLCKDCAEYGSEFCPECLEELDTPTLRLEDKQRFLQQARNEMLASADDWIDNERKIDLPPLRLESNTVDKPKK